MTQRSYEQLLIKAYEEEIGGAAYFDELTTIFTQADEVRKLSVLVELENQTGAALHTLIQKHQLPTLSIEEINQQARKEAHATQGKTWQQLMQLFAKDYPPYIQEFQNTFDLAPIEDKPILQQTIEHEVVLIEFAQKELSSQTHTTDVINQHIAKYRV